MQVVVTGGAGYIGSHTIIELFEHGGFTPYSLDNYNNSSPDNYHRIEKISNQCPDYEKLNLADAKAVEHFFETHPEIEGIVHFAAHKAVGESVEDPLKYYHNNIASLVNLLKAVEKYQIKHFIFSSSCSIYGNIASLPVNEDTLSNGTESPYAETKLMGERILKDFYKTNPHLNCIALRYFNPVGAHPSGLIGELPLNKPNNLVPVITRTAAGLQNKMDVFGSDYNTRDGSCIRDYIHVSDIAKAHVLALDHLNTGNLKANYSIYNLGSGKGVTVFEAISAFEKISGEKVNFSVAPKREGDVEAIFSDSSKVLQDIGWKPTYTLEDMMSSAWKWQQHLLAQVN